MEIALFIIIILVSLLIFYKESSPDIIEVFVKEKGWRFVSKTKGPLELNLLEGLRYSSKSFKNFKEDTFYTVLYYDKRENLHEAILKVNPWSNKVTIFQDKIIE